MATKTQVIKTFLTDNTIADLAERYNHDMECQVNVAQGNGERVEGEYKGRQWHGWINQDSGETWKSFRIPYKANTDPEYTDTELNFNFELSSIIFLGILLTILVNSGKGIVEINLS